MIKKKTICFFFFLLKKDHTLNKKAQTFVLLSIPPHHTGTSVLILNGPVLATDRDIGPNAVVKYGLVGPRMGLFTINPTTGKIPYHFNFIL